MDKIMPTIINGQNLFSVGEIAKATGKSIQTIKRWGQQGKIPKGRRLKTNNWRIYSEQERDIIISFSTQLL